MANYDMGGHYPGVGFDYIDDKERYQWRRGNYP